MKNRKHIVFYIIMALLLSLSQEAFFNDLRIFNAKPNLTLVFLCICATRMDYMEAIIYGAATGTFIDIVYGRSGLDGGGVTVSQDRLVQMFIGIHDPNLQSEIFASVFGKIYIQRIL